MKNNLEFFLKNNFYLILLIILGVIIKFYGYNNEDLWWDELLSFWAADPNVDFNITFTRNLEVNEGTQLIFTYLLKYFFLIFGYNANISRVLTIFFGILSVISLIVLSDKLNIKKSLVFLLTIFLFNSYLISYEHELRSYSFIIFISILNFIFFINLFKKKRNIDYFLVTIVNLVGILNHIFFILISVSQFIFLLINYKINKDLIKFSVFHLIALLIFLIISKDALLLQIDKDEFWIPAITSEFFVDYFFSRFFSSKILAFIYLFSFFFILYNQRNEFFKINTFSFYFIILIFISYFLPLIYGLFSIPVLTDRYILFIVTPILILISFGIMNIKNKILRHVLIFVIIFSTIFDTVLRIYKNEINKPEFKKAVKYIENSSTNIILINNEQNFKIIQNYLIKLNPSLNIINKITADDSELWKLCYLPSTGFVCNIQDDEKKLIQLKTKEFNLIEIKLFRNM